MSTSRDHLHQLIEALPDAELSAAPVGPPFAESIRRGIAQADANDVIVCRSYDEMVSKLLAGE